MVQWFQYWDPSKCSSNLSGLGYEGNNYMPMRFITGRLSCTFFVTVKNVTSSNQGIESHWMIHAWFFGVFFGVNVFSSRIYAHGQESLGIKSIFWLNLTQRKTEAKQNSLFTQASWALYVVWCERGAWPTNALLTFKNFTNLEWKVAESSYFELCVMVDFVPHDCVIISCKKKLTIL